MHNGHLRNVVYIIASLAVLLAGCSNAPGTVETSIQGVLAESSDPSSLFGVGLVLGDQELTIESEIASADVRELAPGYYFSDVYPVAEDGTFTLVFPSSSDIPASTLVAADQFLLTENVELCALESSNDSALVSLHQVGSDMRYGFVALPELFLLDLDGAYPGLTSSAEINLEAVEPPSTPLISWLYATQDVSIESTEPCGTSVDITLQAGWNQVGWTFDVDAETLSLANDSTSPVVLTPNPFY